MKFSINQKRKRYIVSFGSLLPSIIDDLDLRDSFLIENIRELWPKIVGEMISTHSFPDRLFKRTLFVNTDHSVYSNEISMMRDNIIDRVNSTIEFEVVDKLKVEVKTLNWKKDK
ncbi:MAG: DUF721 domain-containing protein [Spirochaetota bacterium]|nr:DUF721 domain-containing protein [Spirochaetota bacterium]